MRLAPSDARNGGCWVPVGDEFNPQLEPKIIILNLSWAIWLRSQMDNCLHRAQAAAFFVLASYLRFC
jgi:hypothetical protein